MAQLQHSILRNRIYLLLLGHWFLLQSLLSVLFPLVLVCCPPPHVLLQDAHGDHKGWGQGCVWHLLSSVWPASLILLWSPPPQVEEQGDQGDQVGWGHSWFLQLLSSVWPASFILAWIPPPQETEQGAHGDQRDTGLDAVTVSAPALISLLIHCRIYELIF